MGKKWDYDVPSVEIWTECLRVLKPGGHLLAFAGTRTQHRMAVRIEDAGFEIRDLIMWHYGSGMPKSHNISNAIDKKLGAERKVIGSMKVTGTARIKGKSGYGGTSGNSNQAYENAKEIREYIEITESATDEVKQWDGWGTALKPSTEVITMARKPFNVSVAENVMKHGTGGINIDACRIELDDDAKKMLGKAKQRTTKPPGKVHFDSDRQVERIKLNEEIDTYKTNGRWPANLIHDGSDEVLKLFPDSGEGSAARFFYCAKTSIKERGENNHHPTVKPIALMSYLCRLVTPTKGIVLDPFMGSGSTGIAALKEGFNFIGIELDENYYNIAKSRIESVKIETTIDEFFDL